MSKPIEVLSEALSRGPGAFVVEEVDEVDRWPLSVVRVDGTVHEVERVLIERADIAATREALAARGLVLGRRASRAPHVWRVCDGGFTLWDTEKGRLLFSDKKTLELGDVVIPVDPAMQVVAYVDPSLIERGVRIVCGERSHPIATHREPRALMDMSYGAIDAAWDSGWTVYLARDLADFLGVALVDST